ncbi:MAG: YbaK/EbsC family protein [Nanoarchaeota archaeon]
MEPLDILSRIIQDLERANIPYERYDHGFVHRSEDAAKVRGTSLSEAAKALVLRSEKGLLMAVIAGPKRIEYRKIKDHIKCKKLSLAEVDAVKQATGLTIGSIPPFGHYWGMDVYVEKGILEHEHVVFSAGSHYTSIRMKTADYLRIVPHHVLAFGSPQETTT